MIPKIDFCNAEYFEQVKTKIDEFEVEYYGEDSKLNYIYQIKK